MELAAMREAGDRLMTLLQYYPIVEPGEIVASIAEWRKAR
jgi:hypothetical protein